MLYAVFDDATSVTYGATGDRPVKYIVQAPDTTTVAANIVAGETYITLSGFIPTDFYKISWVSSAWVLASRASISTIATWNKTTITANGSDTATLGSGLPNPTTIYVRLPASSKINATTDPTATATTGSFSLTTVEAGSYVVSITNPFPYAPYEQVITAT